MWHAKAAVRVALSVVLVIGLCPGVAMAQNDKGRAFEAAGFNGVTNGHSESSEGDVDIQEISDEGISVQASSALTPTSNAWKHEYLTRGSVSRSFLHVNGRGALERVEFADGQLFVEEIAANLKGVNSKRVIASSTYAPSNLRKGADVLWGGFFSGADANYVVTGQENPKENDDLAVFRVTKYSKDWAYLAHAEVRGGNTVEPFDAGTCDMEEIDGSLYVRTCHRMFQSKKDGKNHQANIQLIVREQDMLIESANVEVKHYASGYVSHSFGQYLAKLKGMLYGLDHGDAYPRTIAIQRFSDERGQILSLPGETGQNETGVSVGGFESSESSDTLLAVGNATDLEAYVKAGYDNDSFARNIWVSAISPDLTSSIRYLTSLPTDGDKSVGTPFLVKVSDDRFLALWSECLTPNASGEDWSSEGDWDVGEHTGVVRYQFVDGAGTPLGKAVAVRAMLSDCQPVLYNGSITWYVGSKCVPSIYLINTDTGKFSCVEPPKSISALKNASVELLQTPVGVGDILKFKKSGCPKVVVTLDGKKLKDGKDYVRSFKLDRKRGRVVVTVKGKGLFKSAGKTTRRFNVRRMSLKKCDIGDIPSRAYAGRKIVPKLTIRYGKKKQDFTRWTYVDGRKVVLERKITYKGYVLKLKKGTDYRIACKDNNHPGTAVVKIKGQGMFKGTVIKKFQIT